MANVYGFDPAAWSVDGARHRGELLRFIAYAATGGTEGIIEASDCKVHAITPTAGPQIAIDAGGLLIRNRSASVRNQTYGANGRTESRLDVPATGGSTRSDLVVVRVEDPQYSPWSASAPAPADAPDYQYVKPFLVPNVPNTTTLASQLNLGYSAVELARLDIPPGTTTITSGMIVDLRKLAQPRRQSFIQRYNGPDGTTAFTDSPLAWTRFPPASQIGLASIPVPAWATRARVRAFVSGVQVVDGGIHGWLRYKLSGGVPSTDIYTDTTVMAEGSPGYGRVNTEISSEITIPPGMRGRTITGNGEWQERTGTGRLRTDGDIAIVIDIVWLEVAE